MDLSDPPPLKCSINRSCSASIVGASKENAFSEETVVSVVLGAKYSNKNSDNIN